MIGWMPAPLNRMLNALLCSSTAGPSARKTEEPYIGSGGRPIFGSHLYGQIREEDRKRNLALLAEEAEAARKIRDLPNS